jgi:hypothetical protein
VRENNRMRDTNAIIRDFANRLVADEKARLTRNAYYAAGIREGLTDILTKMFSAEGLKRAVAAYDSADRQDPESAMAQALAASIEATDYLTFTDDEPRDESVEEPVVGVGIDVRCPYRG